MKRSIALVLVLALSSCVPSPPDNDIVKRYDPEETTMGRIQEEGVLRYSVSQDMGAGLLSFFDAIAEDVAASLGVEAEAVTTSDPLVAVDDGDADMAFTLDPITYSRVQERPYTDPFWVGHQRLLVAADSGIEDIEDLAGAEVCAPAEDPTITPMAELQPAADVVQTDVLECIVRAHAESTVITATDLVLAALVSTPDVAADFEVAGDQLSTVGYGLAVTEGAGSWESYISTQINEAVSEGRWQTWYDEHVAPLGIESEPPELSVEDAAALWPDA